MNKAKYFDIIRSPIVTEKATHFAEQGKYIVKVSVDSTKLQIKNAISHIFNVEVLSVNTLINKGKAKRFKGFTGKRNDFKKAIVTLKKGQEINFIGEA